ncbi:MAG: hypothetical protein ABIQ65_09165 [Thermoanaerobaculia bacterium]
MDCRTADLLIEAFHDDELEVAQVAGLMAHVECCPPCRLRHESVQQLRELCRQERPADRCPDELKRRLASCLPGERARRRLPAIRSVTIVLLASGLGFVLGRKLPHASASAWNDGAALVALRPHEVAGEILCLRCALEKALPGTTLAGKNHPPVLKTSDGRLFLLADHAGLGFSADALLGSGCQARHVRVTARLDPEHAVADVVSLAPGLAGSESSTGTTRTLFVRNSDARPPAR